MGITREKEKGIKRERKSEVANGVKLGIFEMTMK